jgi:hypothetical protein
VDGLGVQLDGEGELLDRQVLLPKLHVDLAQ